MCLSGKQKTQAHTTPVKGTEILGTEKRRWESPPLQITEATPKKPTPQKENNSGIALQKTTFEWTSKEPEAD